MPSSAFPIRHNVYGSAENAFLSHAGGHLGKKPGAMIVDAAVPVQKTEHYAVRTVFQKKLRIFNSGSEFRIAIAEAALP